MKKPISQHPDWIDTFNVGKYTEVSLDGDWHKLPRLFRELGSGSMNRGVKRDMAKAMRNFTQIYKRNLIAGLSSGGRAIGQAWSHSGSYTGSGTVGIATGNYLQALTNLRITQNKYMMTLRFAKGDLNRRSIGGITLGQYSVYFEKGTSKQPARPLWHYAYLQTGGQKKLLQYLKGAVGRRLRTLTT